MFDAFIEGLQLVLRWPSAGFLVLGTLMGILLGAIPGLGGVIGLVAMLPFTLSMDPVSAFALLLSFYAVTGQGDTITAIMLGVPGTVAGQATMLDGYPLAKQGQAARAFGAAFTVSAVGGVIGAVVLALSLPLIQPIVLLFGAPEIFMLGMVGLVMVGSISGRSLLKGLIAAMLGLLLATVGYAETMAIPRYWFGTTYLLDSFPLVPAILGFMALPELIDLARRNRPISDVPRDQLQGGGVLAGMRDAIREWWLVLRCSALGIYIGILPALGPAISDWMAYGHALQSAKDKSRFGKGDIRGVIAPEAATAATRPGDLIPTVAFGIPGSLACAILMGALLIQGLRPGPEMLTTKVTTTFAMVWTMILANILAALVLLMWMRQVAKVSFINSHLIVPAVVVFIFMGAFLDNASVGDWIVCLGMGTLGYAMKRGGWARPPLVLAFVLGRILESNFLISNQAYAGLSWLGRPTVLVLLAIVLLTVVLVARAALKPSVEAPKVVEAVAGGETRGAAEEPEPEPSTVVSLCIAAGLAGLFAYASFEALQWPGPVQVFPQLACIGGGLLALWLIVREARTIPQRIRRFGGIGDALRSGWTGFSRDRSVELLVVLAAMVVLAPLIGQIAALALFVLYYLQRWGKFGWAVTLGYGVAVLVFLFGIYDRILHVQWLRPWLFP